MEATPNNAPVQSQAPAQKPARPAFAISERAAKEIQRLRTERGTPDAALRIAIKGGGCSGLTYVLEWADQPKERDKVFERDGVKVVVDPKSYLYLMGSELVWQETLMSSGFKIENPKVKSACGCGESFAI
ncbi:MAG: iron-sulfur cluster assembly accessory protein [Myxococcaceae bacterium]|nr:iron-sulfur cluster assembly accessory protein [Myxococcaceae bacterium]